MNDIQDLRYQWHASIDPASLVSQVCVVIEQEN